MRKLWDKGDALHPKIESYTVGEDHILDLQLVRYDCKASIAHAMMLEKAGILTPKERGQISAELEAIIREAEKGEFRIKKEDEDCHTAIENRLAAKLGKTGRKIHTARSRNDQVLAAMRLYEKAELEEVKSLIGLFRETLKKRIGECGKIPMPGYTHMRKAMPTDIGTWLGSFEESMEKNIELLQHIISTIDLSPLGTAAGFGVPVIDIDRSIPAKELGFAGMIKNPVFAQHSRGKFEGLLMGVLSSIMLDLNKLATDLLIFSMEQIGYVSLPGKISTGSSIMPQKKNPDALELVRGNYHIMLGEELKVKSLPADLISGYNRDMQLLKGPVMRSLQMVKDALEVMEIVAKKMTIDENSCRKAITREMHATEEAYKLVKKGMAFRDAYQQVAKDMKSEAKVVRKEAKDLRREGKGYES